MSLKDLLPVPSSALYSNSTESWFLFPRGDIEVFWSCTHSSSASSDMLIDAFRFFSASVLPALSGELLPLCDLPWEFNSGCDHTSADETGAHTQQSASRGVS